MCQNVIVVLASENTTVPTACCGFQKYSPSLPQGDSIKQASAMVAKTEKKKKKKKASLEWIYRRGSAKAVLRRGRSELSARNPSGGANPSRHLEIDIPVRGPVGFSTSMDGYLLASIMGHPFFSYNRRTMDSGL